MTVRRVVALAVATLVCAAGVVVPATTAYGAPPLDEARRKARALRQAVLKLELDAAVAVEDYNEAYDELAKATSARLEAQAALDRARAAAEVDRDAIGQRIRALYMTGGSISLYASVLDSADLHDAFGRLANVSAVLRHDGVALGGAEDGVRAAEAAATKLREIALKQTKLERRVAAATTRIEAALASQRALLTQADARVRQLAEEERRAAEAAEAAAFAARVAAAAGAAGSQGSNVTGPILGALKNQTTTPPNAVVARAIAAARTRLGRPYVWGATGPDTFDCSGLTGWAYKQAGVSLPRTSRQQWFHGTHPDIAALLPGDLLFWGPDRSNPQSIHHVALYIGGGMMIAAPRTGTVVRIQPVYQGDFFGVTRPHLT